MKYKNFKTSQVNMYNLDYMNIIKLLVLEFACSHLTLFYGRSVSDSFNNELYQLPLHQSPLSCAYILLLNTTGANNNSKNYAHII